MNAPAPASEKRFAVIGGKGFVGSAIVRALQARDADVTVIDKDEYADCVGQSFDILINANGNSKKYLSRKEPANEFDLSVRSVMRSLHDFQYGLYVHLSTIDVYPDHENPANNHENVPIDVKQLSPYGLHKYMAEELVRYYAPRWFVFRMAGFVGPGLWKNSIYDLLTGTPLRVNLDSAYQYLHTSQLAQGILDTIERAPEGQTFNITGNGVVKLRDIAALVPDQPATVLDANVPAEHYEVNLEKISKWVDLPQTRDAVAAFIEGVQSGKETIR